MFVLDAKVMFQTKITTIDFDKRAKIAQTKEKRK